VSVSGHQIAGGSYADDPTRYPAISKRLIPSTGPAIFQVLGFEDYAAALGSATDLRRTQSWEVKLQKKLSVAIVAVAILVVPFVARSEEPDALGVEWQGKKPCEKLHEDDQIRILRCTFPPGAKHVRHQHPAYFFYTLSGGKLEVINETGTIQREAIADAFALNAPVPWHEVTNVGDTRIRYLIVEMKNRK
jgi:quercetin dioxygenase-like cupin family protein